MRFNIKSIISLCFCTIFALALIGCAKNAKSPNILSQSTQTETEYLKAIIASFQNDKSGIYEYLQMVDLNLFLGDLKAALAEDSSFAMLAGFNLPSSSQKGQISKEADLGGYLSLMDRKHSLSEKYEPSDLVSLNSYFYETSRYGMKLRNAAASALEKMAEAAQKDKIKLVVSSTYRSYAYQKEVFARNLEKYGKERALATSAQPGFSQHQLGSVIDFGSIDDSFCGSKEEQWLAQNAAAFGFSLSFPKNMQEQTGFIGECWHYRFIGQNAAIFAHNHFGGLQIHALRFIAAYRNLL